MKKKYSIFPFIKNTLTYDKNWQRTWKNPKTKKNKDIDKLSKVFFLVIFFLIISLAFNHNLFRKFYNILKSDFEARIIKTYGFCGGESIGFLRMIKKKYKLNTNPSVINFEVNPSSLWAIYNTNIEESNGSNIIFLNYHKYLKTIFKKSNDVFAMHTHYENTDAISKIIFYPNNNSISLNNNVTIYKIIENGKKKIIYKKKIISNFDEKNIININFKTKELNSRRLPIFIEIENLEKNTLNNISSVALVLKNSYSIENYKIIEKQENCYYVTN